MDIAELGRVVGADRQQSGFRRQAAVDLAESGKISCVSSVIDRVFARFQNEAAVATVRIFENACAPMPRGNMRHLQASMARGLPPIEFDDFGKAKVGDQM